LQQGRLVGADLRRLPRVVVAQHRLLEHQRIRPQGTAELGANAGRQVAATEHQAGSGVTGYRLQSRQRAVQSKRVGRHDGHSDRTGVETPIETGNEVETWFQ
jgi:hypothetical protein